MSCERGWLRGIAFESAWFGIPIAGEVVDARDGFGVSPPRPGRANFLSLFWAVCQREFPSNVSSVGDDQLRCL